MKKLGVLGNTTYQRVRENVPKTHPSILYGEYRIFTKTRLTEIEAREVIVLAYKFAQEELRKRGYDVHEESNDIVFTENF